MPCAAFPALTVHTPSLSSSAESWRTARQVLEAFTRTADPRLGGHTVIEVLDAQRAYRDTYRLYITNRANYWRSLYRLNAAVGKRILDDRGVVPPACPP